MIRMIHAADVHLKESEKTYGLAVLKEIVEIAAQESADFLLLCGDLFDTYPDAVALRRDVAETVKGYKAEILYIPGNHEEHGRTGNLDNLDFGQIKPITTIPFSLISRTVRNEPIEFLIVPHSNNFSRWRDWGIAPPQALLGTIDHGRLDEAFRQRLDLAAKTIM